ncbi:FliM/FliN family flagellar motor switch protein [bacterium]|nr:FliM/FliN family flagellar motor switch protein [bacterium]
MNSRSQESETKGFIPQKIPEELEFLSEVTVKISARLGGCKMIVRDLLTLNKDAIIELDRLAGDTADLLINDVPFAKGEVIMIGQSFGIRITEFLSVKK